jgi:hypothetical protein
MNLHEEGRSSGAKPAAPITVVHHGRPEKVSLTSPNAVVAATNDQATRLPRRTNTTIARRNSGAPIAAAGGGADEPHESDDPETTAIAA